MLIPVGFLSEPQIASSWQDRRQLLDVERGDSLENSVVLCLSKQVKHAWCELPSAKDKLEQLLDDMLLYACQRRNPARATLSD